ncbi:MAG: acyl-CoA thioesterase-1 [Cocleimonas sp.]|jgi:acyl-CoA thioesterase-1
MGFVPHLFKKTSLFIGVLCISLLTSNSHASTKILVWGDSLSAAYGIPVEKGWVSLLEEKLGDNFEVINGSISGETTQGGLTRLPAALKNHTPDLVILELGANDGLRGFPPQITKNNLQQMIEKSHQANAKVVLFGMKIPPNYGVIYSEKFEEQFVQLANDYNLPFIPFFLKDVIENIEFFQADELHPTAAAQPIILETILPTLNIAFDNITQKEADTSSNPKEMSQSAVKDPIEKVLQETLPKSEAPIIIKNPA